MASKQMPIRLFDQERELLDTLAEILSVEKGETIEPTSAILIAIREALVKRGVSVSDNLFGKKREGRPKPVALKKLNPQGSGLNNTAVGARTPAAALIS